ncbi:MAG: alpha/beta fold hydrolase [Bacillota bacterium]
MNNIRLYGDKPYRVAVVHGGPGAPGSVAAVARELSRDMGVMEPLQTATSLDGQIEELHDVLAKHSNLPVILIGYSWGAWLVYLMAARYPETVAKLIMVGSPAFRSEYVRLLSQTRLSRLSPEERAEFNELLIYLHNPEADGKDDKMARLGELAEQADSYDPITIATDKQDMIKADGNMYSGVWNEAAAMRSSGELVDYAQRLTCPVVAIHGDYDSSPAAGAEEPLRGLIKDFRFTVLERCGHSPWKERHAHERFYEVLRQEITTSPQPAAHGPQPAAHGPQPTARSPR